MIAVIGRAALISFVAYIHRIYTTRSRLHGVFHLNPHSTSCMHDNNLSCVFPVCIASVNRVQKTTRLMVFYAQQRINDNFISKLYCTVVSFGKKSLMNVRHNLLI